MLGLGDALTQGFAHEELGDEATELTVVVEVIVVHERVQIPQDARVLQPCEDAGFAFKQPGFAVRQATQRHAGSGWDSFLVGEAFGSENRPFSSATKALEDAKISDASVSGF
jgi:hypothetical protein